MTKASTRLANFMVPLTPMQRLYVQGILKGLNKTAAATAAGCANPRKNFMRLDGDPAVKEAIKAGLAVFSETVLFDRKEAHDMLMEAHRNAATATEQVLAIREMIKLHGIAAPEVKEIRQQITGKVTHEQVQRLTDADLLKLAKLDDDKVPEILEGEYSLVETDGN